MSFRSSSFDERFFEAYVTNVIRAAQIVLVCPYYRSHTHSSCTGWCSGAHMVECVLSRMIGIGNRHSILGFCVREVVVVREDVTSCLSINVHFLPSPKRRQQSLHLVADLFWLGFSLSLSLSLFLVLLFLFVCLSRDPGWVYGKWFK